MHYLKRLSIFAALVLASNCACDAQTLDFSTWHDIDSVLNAYSFNVDARPIPDFDAVFAEDAVFVNGPQIITGLKNITASLQSLDSLQSQHLLGSKNITLNTDGTASAWTDYVATLWGTGDQQYDHYQNNFRFYDTISRETGRWLITNKTAVRLTPSQGNLTAPPAFNPSPSAAARFMMK